MIYHNQCHKYPNTKQQGFSIVELMIAMVIGLLLLAGVMQIFISNKQTHQLQSAMARVQENGRIAMQIITQDIRMADFWGCNTDATNITSDIIEGATTIDPLEGGIQGTDGAAGTGGAPDAPDTIVLQGAFGGAIQLVAPYMNTKASTLHASAGATSLSIGDILLLSDCSAGDIFQITNLQTQSAKQSNVVHNANKSGSSKNVTGDLTNTYEGDAGIYAVRKITYTVTDNALTITETDGSPQVLVEGVENMQVEYGIDTTGPDADGNLILNQYQPAATINVTPANWSNVVSVRITLIMRSEDNIATDTDTTYSDNRLRRTFTSTVTIRNRLI